MRRMDRYIKDTRKHLPEKYELTAAEMLKISEEIMTDRYSGIISAYLLGFESAYRAAKAGKLDFQQKCRKGIAV